MTRKPPHILLVDDDESMRDSIAFALRDRGVVVSEQTSGNRALAFLQSHSVDLIITDIRMPDGDGIALLTAVAQLKPRPPVIVISGFSVDEEELMAQGAYGILMKPFDLKQLYSLVSEATNFF